ncbi:winged helix-turn-helix domain-containing protein [Vibrio lamellibrachiae]|uniref:winged helix-turn-helix domain-containing protein n=1 Tax=Vibrio lamellibrachiae TaxID=2910253 RepID=UPI003D1159FA
MSSHTFEPPIYQIGEYRYSVTSGIVKFKQDVIRLRAMEANLFTALVESFPEILSRQAIEQRLWSNSYATNATINQTVKGLRDSLLDTDRELIRTIPKQGYVLSIQPIITEGLKERDARDVKKGAIGPLDNDNDELMEAAILPSIKDLDGIETKNKTSNSKQVAFRLIVGLISAFVLGFLLSMSISSGQDKSLYKGHWIMFSATAEDLEKLPLIEGPTSYFVFKDQYGYKLCESVGDTLKCHFVD